MNFDNENRSFESNQHLRPSHLPMRQYIWNRNKFLFKIAYLNLKYIYCVPKKLIQITVVNSPIYKNHWKE